MLKEDLNDSDERKKLKTFFTGLLENKRKQQTDPIIYPDNKVSQRVLELLQSCAKEGGKRRINQMLEQGFFCMGKCELKCHCEKSKIPWQSFILSVSDELVLQLETKDIEIGKIRIYCYQDNFSSSIRYNSAGEADHMNSLH